MKVTISVKMRWDAQDRGKTNFRLFVFERANVRSFLLLKNEVRIIGKRKTNEEFINQLIEINSNIKALDVYVDSRIKIEFECLICGHKWKTFPGHILQGKGCSECARNRITKSHEQFIKELNDINQNIVCLDKYINAYTKIRFKCLICGHIWETTPEHVLKGQGCSKCSIKKSRKTHEEFINELNIINPNIKVLEKYIDNKTKLLCECLIDGNKWRATPNSLLSNHGCKECKKRNMILDEDDFFNRAKEYCPDIKILTKYTKATDDYLCECKICGHQWITNGSNIIKGGTGCRECYRNNKRLSNEDFLERLFEITDSIIPLEKYYDSKTKIRFKCKHCNHEWKAAPFNILNGNGCPECKYSSGEQKVKDVLLKNDILYIPQKTYKNLKGVGGKYLSYDFYLPEYSLLIEFQGKQHEHPVSYFGGEEKFNIQKEHDRRKKEYAELHNINLLEIWYYDINNIEEILNKTINNLKLESVETVTVA